MDAWTYDSSSYPVFGLLEKAFQSWRTNRVRYWSCAALNICEGPLPINIASFSKPLQQVHNGRVITGNSSLCSEKSTMFLLGLQCQYLAITFVSYGKKNTSLHPNLFFTLFILVCRWRNHLTLLNQLNGLLLCWWCNIEMSDIISFAANLNFLHHCRSSKWCSFFLALL